jgi:hypothetical protein
MSTSPAQARFCAHADADGDATGCGCTANTTCDRCGWTGPGVEQRGGHSVCATCAPGDAHPAVDVGPATQAPAWCLPGATPEWYALTEEAGGGIVASWERTVGDGDVWIGCEDHVIDGRVQRSAPLIGYTEPPGRTGGVDSAAALALARALVAATDILRNADESVR